MNNSDYDYDSDSDAGLNMKFDNSNVDMGFMKFDNFLKLPLLDANAKKNISDSRNYRNQHFDEPMDMLEYSSSDIIQECKDNLLNGTILEGRILTEYTQDTDADDLKKEIEDQNGNTFDIQVAYPVSFRLVKLISSFPYILTSLSDSVIHLPEYIMDYLKTESLMDDSETPFDLKKKFIIDWTKINNIFCKQIYRILADWPIRLTTSFIVYTGFNFEIPNVGNFRDNTIRQLKDANEEDLIMLPFVLSTSISPYVAKRFAQNETDIILQIAIPMGFPIPYISKKESQELEVLLNMYGRYRKKTPDGMKSELRDVEERVICLQLEGFEELDDNILDKSTINICDIILGFSDSDVTNNDDNDIESQSKGGKKKRRTNKRTQTKNQNNKRTQTKKQNNKRTQTKKRNHKRRQTKRQKNRRRTNKRYNKRKI
jgi:hypothetical protein